MSEKRPSKEEIEEYKAQFNTGRSYEEAVEIEKEVISE